MRHGPDEWASLLLNVSVNYVEECFFASDGEFEQCGEETTAIRMELVKKRALCSNPCLKAK